MLYRFADMELDTQRIELRRGSATHKLGPRIYAFLLQLIRNRDRVVSKGELLDAVWSGTTVSESALQQCATQLRRVLGQQRGSTPIIEAVYGQGYRFVSSVVEIAENPGNEASAAASDASQVVGRRGELRALNGALDRLEKGIGGLVLLSGPAGIGKTHLLRELSLAGERRGLPVRHGRCQEEGATPAYWPLSQALHEELDQGAERDVVAEEFLAELSPLVSDNGSAGGTRERLFSQLQRFLVLRGERRPTLLLLDDMHRADASSLELLAFLAPELEKTGWLVVVAHRPPGPESAAYATLEACAGWPTTQRLSLDPLKPSEAGELIRRSTGQEPSPAVVATLHERSGGNPFLATQLIPYLDPARNEYPEVRVLDRLPGSVREAVARQLVDLSPSATDVLTRASVLGRDAEVRVIADLCGVGLDELNRALDEARSVGLLEDSPFGRGFVRFVHTLIVEVLYEALSTRRAARLHARAADAIEAGSPAPGPWLSEIARHRLAAIPICDVALARETTLRAAEWSADRLAFETAANLVDRLRNLDSSEPRVASDQLELELRSAELWESAGDVKQMRERALEACDAARAAGDPRALARALLLYSGSYGERARGSTAQQLESMIAEALQALAGSAEQVDVGWRARLLARLAIQRQYTPEATEAAALTARARSEAQGLADPVPLGHALLASALNPPLEQLRDAPQWAARAVQIGERSKQNELVCMGRHFEAIAHFRLAEFDAAYAAWDLAAEEAEESGTPRARYYPALVRGMRSVLGHEAGDRYAIFTAARDIGSRAFGEQSELLFSAQGLSSHYQVSGAREEFVPIARKLVDGDPDQLALRMSLACILLALEDDDALLEQVHILVPRLLGRAPVDAIELGAIHELSHMLVHLGACEEAATAYTLMLPYAEVVNLVDLGSRGGDPTHLPLGRLATLLGRADAAVAHLERSLQIALLAEATTVVARTRLFLAEALLLRAGAADRRKARSELDACLEFARAAGMSPSVRAARDLIQGLAEG